MKAIIEKPKFEKIISQRLLRTTRKFQNKNVSTEDVLAYLIRQDRDMTENEVMEEAAKIKQLSNDAFHRINQMQTEDCRGQLIQKLKEMDFSESELRVLIARVTSHLQENLKVPKRAHIWNFTEDQCSALDHIMKANRADHDSGMTPGYLTDLLADCLREEHLIRIAGGASEQGHDEIYEPFVWEDVLHDPALAVKAVKILRERGKLPDQWKNIPESEIPKLLNIAAEEPLSSYSGEALIDTLLDVMIDDMMILYTEHQASAPSEVRTASEDELPIRSYLALAAILNMKETQHEELPEELAKLTDEQLALASAAATKLSYYFDEATKGNLSEEDFEAIAIMIFTSLIMGIFTGAFALSALAASAPIIAIPLSFSTAFCALCTFCLLCGLVDVFVNAAFPAGLDETHPAVFMKATGRKLRVFVNNLLERIASHFNVSQDNNGEPEYENEYTPIDEEYVWDPAHDTNEYEETNLNHEEE